MSKTVIAIDPLPDLKGISRSRCRWRTAKSPTHGSPAACSGVRGHPARAESPRRFPDRTAHLRRVSCGPRNGVILAIEAVCGVEVPENGRIARNLMLAGNYLQSNILHFYHLGGQDYFHGPDTVPFIPRYRNPDLRLSEEQNTLAMDEYIEALEVRQVCHQLVALFGGRMPHLQGILGGGAAQIPDRETILEYAARMKQVRKFVENRYLPLVYTIASRYMDMFEMAHGYKNALCVGVFPLAKKGEQFFNAGAYINGRDEPFDGNRILEDVRYSWFEPAPSGTPLQKSESIRRWTRRGAYSFIKGPLVCRASGRSRPAGAHVDQRQAAFAHWPTVLCRYVRRPRGDVPPDRRDPAFSIMGRNVARRGGVSDPRHDRVLAARAGAGRADLRLAGSPAGRGRASALPKRRAARCATTCA